MENIVYIYIINQIKKQKMAISKKQLEQSWLFELFDESYQEHIKQKMDDEYQYHEYLKTLEQ
jgi:hypothetical protein